MAAKKTKKKTKILKQHNKTRTTRRPRIRALRASEVRHMCPNTIFKFRSTRDLDVHDEFIAQNRAVAAIEMGLGISKPGYNIYVAGHQGTGKTSIIRSFLEKHAANRPVPPDWVYVYNFDNPKLPLALQLPAGEGRRLRKTMEHFIRELRQEIPKTLQSENYENAINTYISAANERKAKLFGELEKLAKTLDFTIKSTRLGIETIPIYNGRPLSEKEYSKLDDKKREEIEAARAKLEPEVLDFARKIRNIEQETQSYIDSLRHDYGLAIVGELINPIIDHYSEQNLNNVVEHLRQVRDHIVDHLLDFVEIDTHPEDEEQPAMAVIHDERNPLRKYEINVFVDNASTKGAPVILEPNPTYYNLFGKIEKSIEHGVYQTDFTMIKSGSIHQANGGYLVIHTNDLFVNQGTWDTLKRVLKNRLGFIEDLGEQFAMLPTSGLRPQPIDLDVKVILIGSDHIYRLLFEEDEEFSKIFKIKAEFDFKMPRTKENIHAYASFVATRVAKENLLPFDRSAIAAIVEYSSRLVEDQNQLSTQFGEIKDLTIEADYLARQDHIKQIKREHIERAIDHKFYRLNLYEEHLLEMVADQDILLSVDGERVGQINGLTVYDFGDYSFGKICRITCTTGISDDGITNIERAVRLSGKTHDKGMFIISGFINAVLAREHNLGISASVCFEQSYGYIDGDSASAAELICILSSLSEIPIQQNFAITGSVNQMGEIQAIGGVNEKIEGFYKTVKLIGKGSRYHVVIPEANRDNLMLHKEVQEAVRSGFLYIYPVKYIWDAFELVCNTPLGIRDIHTKNFAPGSALEKIRKKLDQLHDHEEKMHHDDEKTQHKKARKKLAAQPMQSMSKQ